MAELDKLGIHFLVAIVLFSGAVDAYKTCSNNYHWVSVPVYCKDHQYCCEKNGYKQCCEISLATGAIVGIVIGAMFVVGLIVVCVCICAQKSKAKQGHMIYPNNHASVAVVSTTNAQHMSQPYGAPGQGNMYGVPQGPSNVYAGQQAVPPPYGEPQYPPHALPK